MSSTEKIHVDFFPLPIASTPPSGVDLWLLDLSIYSCKSPAEFSSSVTPDEIVRAQQLKHNPSHFLATRALLRAAIAHYTGMEAQDLLFARQTHGKPFLLKASANIHFNLSHCATFAVLAITAKNPLGVDIETMGSRDYLKLARRYFHDDELQALTACTEPERKILFYKLWTLKEAFLKATGGGIASGLDKIAFVLADNKITAAINPVLNQHRTSWQFHQEFITPDTLVALAFDCIQDTRPRWLNGNELVDKLLPP